MRQTLKVATSEHDEHMTMDPFPKQQMKKGQVSLACLCLFSHFCTRSYGLGLGLRLGLHVGVGEDLPVCVCSAILALMIILVSGADVDPFQQFINYATHL